jgi:hypothetical protein
MQASQVVVSATVCYSLCSGSSDLQSRTWAMVSTISSVGLLIVKQMHGHFSSQNSAS